MCGYGNDVYIFVMVAQSTLHVVPSKDVYADGMSYSCWIRPAKNMIEDTEEMTVENLSSTFARAPAKFHFTVFKLLLQYKWTLH